MPMKRQIRRKIKNSNKGPKILSFIAYTLILFFGTTILVNMNPNANESYRIDWEERNNKSMKWIFLADNGKEYNIFAPRNSLDWEHGAADTFDYLLPPTLEEINEISQKEKEEKAQKREEKRYYDLINWTPEVAEIPVWENALAPTTPYVEPEEQEHGSAQLEEEIETQETTGDVQEIKQPKEAYAELWDTLEDRSAFLNMVFEYLLAWKIKQLPEGAVRYVVTLYWIDEETQDMVFEERGCMTPWWYEIEHGQSVLAYKQRTDAINVCSIQRRVCKNGKLSWSYTQYACDETLWADWNVPSSSSDSSSSNGVVKKVAYSVYNSQKLDEYIQPSEHAKNENAEFDVHWKINTTTQPKITQNPEGDAISPEKEPVAQVRDLWKLCKTPWWETVKPWQFVKAYRFQNGFYDIPCQVQLRLCVDGDLEWLYEYPSCQPWETSYEDFLYGYMNNEQPSPQRLLKMLRTDFQPRPEYGNNLSSELIDQMLKILRD